LKDAEAQGCKRFRLGRNSDVNRQTLTDGIVGGSAAGADRSRELFNRQGCILITHRRGLIHAEAGLTICNERSSWQRWVHPRD
jgi:hypothetical protein